MNAALVGQYADDVLAACTVDDSGAVALAEAAYLAIGKRIHESVERAAWATALIAVSTRLRALNVAGDAAQKSAALAAVALGDVDENGALCRALYRRG